MLEDDSDTDVFEDFSNKVKKGLFSKGKHTAAAAAGKKTQPERKTTARTTGAKAGRAGKSATATLQAKVATTKGSKRITKKRKAPFDEEDDEELADEEEGLDEAAKQNAMIYKFFDTLEDDYYLCHGCQKSYSARGNNGNLHKHQRICKGLNTAIETGKEGITQANRNFAAERKQKKKQATLDTENLQVRPVFSQKGMNAHLVHWLISTNQPFLAVQHASFRTMVRFSNPNFTIPSRNTMANYTKKLYNLAKERLDVTLRDISRETMIHYAQDCWTDKGMQNCYIGIYAYYIDSKFALQQVLLRFMRINGKHTGKRIGTALYQLFNEIGIASAIGPGTGDNASNNKAAARFLADLLRSGLGLGIFGADMIGCICHIINLAAKDFLALESE
jgi:hypothetical protein